MAHHAETSRRCRRGAVAAGALSLCLAAAGGAAPAQPAPGGATGDPIRLVAAFDGLGHRFQGPHGRVTLRNPSDNSLAVGPRHVVQTVNSQLAVFTRRGRPVYGPLPTNLVFQGFGGPCETLLSGDAVVRYDQLARRWLLVMPVFRKSLPTGAPEGPRAARLPIPPARATPCRARRRRAPAPSRRWGSTPCATP